jgi:uroporphyrinogen decarboxylase
MQPMTPRERLLTALNHEEPDQVPLFLGASGSTSMLTPLYEKFKARFGIDSPTRFLSRSAQQVMIDERIRDRFGAIGQPILAGPPISTLAKDISDDCFVDALGITWRRSPGNTYFEIHNHPLQNARIEDLDRYPWPDLAHPSRFEGLRAQAQSLQAAGQAVVFYAATGVFSPAFDIRGGAQLLFDLAGNEDFATALFAKMEALSSSFLRAALREIGDCVDLVVTGDDLATQAGPMMSPAMYRRLIKPHQAKMYAAVRENTQAKIYLHCCGNVYRLIGDLIELGIDLLNPVQVSAGEMGDTARLKREFGDRMAFCGGIDTQRVLPFGTPDEVRAEVRRRIRDLAPGGGYVAAAVHCIQPDVPIENVLAMCEEIAAVGKYPLQI